MQRVRDLDSRKKQKVVTTPRKAYLPYISPEIAYMIANYEPRLKKMVEKLINENNAKNKGPFNQFTATELAFDDLILLSHNLRFFTKLTSLEISNRQAFHFSALNHVDLNLLVLNNVGHFSFEGSEPSKIFKLEIKNTTISLDTLSELISHCKPKSLTLENVTNKKTSRTSEMKLYSCILSLPLISLSIVNSLIPFDIFSKIISKLMIRAYKFENTDLKIEYINLGRSLVTLITNNQPFLNENELMEIESLSILGKHAIHLLNNKFNRLRQLYLENCDIETKSFKMLQNIEQLSLFGCSFVGLAFYHLISKFKSSLRYFSINSTLLPLDGVQYLQQNLSNCLVSAGGAMAFYIPKKPEL